MIPSRTIAPATHAHNFKAPSTTKQVVVLGSPRGGTSMVAGILVQLGLFMGDKLDPDNLEDQDFMSHQGDRELFKSAARSGDLLKFIEKVQQVVSERNKTHEAWGWKDPLSIHYVKQLHSLCPELRIVAIFRDIAAVAQREYLEIGVKGSTATQNTFLNDAEVTLTHYAEMLKFIRDSGVPALVISYERAIRHPTKLLEEISIFLGVEVTEEKLRELSSYIQGDRLTAAISKTTVGTRPTRGFSVHTDNRLEKILSAAISEGDAASPQKGMANLALQKLTVGDAYAVCVSYLERQDYLSAEATSIRLVSSLAKQPYDIAQTVELINIGSHDSYENVVEQGVADYVCGCLYIAGMAALLSGDYLTASDFFRLSYGIAQRVLLTDSEQSSIARSIGISAVFHWGVAEKNLGNTRKVSEIRRHLTMYGQFQASTNPEAALLETINSFGERAKAELT